MKPLGDILIAALAALLLADFVLALRPVEATNCAAAFDDAAKAFVQARWHQ